ncbi:MAG TPA: diiron oxygenase [Streptosporangiaceae bacterium]|nr:diiron oxygenase [Streptosporangiaceae bacterium]
MGTNTIELPARAATATDRERVADRLLRSTAARGYDPELDIDWSAPPEPGKIFLPEHRSTLYGTPLWDRLTPEQRRELGKHEAASVAGFGIWLECILMRLLAKLAYEENPVTRHVQYALAEMAEECRHSMMFARLIEWMGVPYYGPPRYVHALGRLLTATAHGPVMWGAILIGEEITDRYQREMVTDESMQPIVRMVNKIHILEEARHIGFARAELTRSAAKLPLAELPVQRAMLGRVAFIVARNLISPEVYRSVGLDPAQARRVALANPAHHETIRYGGEKIVAFLREAGMIGPPATRLWRKAHMID